MKDISFFDEHGLAVIPLQPKSKKTAIVGWTSQCTDDNELL
jgi:hypothetical protein